MTPRVLAIDDDADVLKLLKTRLEAAERFTVLCAVGGREGVAAAGRELPDLILCDIDMPDMDGGQVATALAAGAATKDIPMIFLSGLVSTREIGDGARTGRWPVMSKESPIETVIRKIDASLAAK